MSTSLKIIYEPLDAGRRQIRLMRLVPKDISETICCMLETFDFDDVPEYRALSYEWGPKDLRGINVNGHDFEVRSNLHEFLKVYSTWSNSTSDWIWIDQVCIDQTSIRERNHQVGLIEHIFRGAEETFCWLGTDPTNGVCLKTIHQVVARFRQVSVDLNNSNHGMQESDREAIKEAVLKLYDSFDNEQLSSIDHVRHNTYWTRHWVVQEIALSRQRYIVFGHTALPWDQLFDFYHEDEMQALGPHTGRFAPHVLVALGQLSEVTNEALLWTVCMGLATETSCSDVRDKVYAIQGLFPPEHRISVDYSLSARRVLINSLCKFEEIYSQPILQWFLCACRSLAQGMGFSAGLDAWSEVVKEYLLTKDTRTEFQNKVMFGLLAEMQFSSELPRYMPIVIRSNSCL